MANRQNNTEKPQGEVLKDQPKGIVGKLLSALKLSMAPEEKSQLQDQLAHKAENGKQPNLFEKAANLKEFNENTLIRFFLYAAAMLANKDDNDGDVHKLASAAEDEAAQKKAQQKMSLKDARNTLEGSEISGLAGKVIETVHKVTSGIMEKFIPADCGKWADQIYRMSGVKAKCVWPARDQLKVVDGATQQIRDLKSGNLPQGENEALEMVKPGDYLFYYNKNGFGKGKNWESQHASIFLGWIDKSNHIAKMASGSYKVAGREQTINLAAKPITRIHKPQAV